MALVYEFTDIDNGDVHNVVMNYHVNYVFNDGTKSPMPTQSVWCDQCGFATVAESIESNIDKQEQRAELNGIISGNITDAIWPGDGSRFTPQKAKAELQRLEQFWSRFNDRTTPSRCLTCSSFSFTPLKLNGITNVHNGPKLECTGWLTASMIEEPKEQKFTPDGLPIVG